MRNFITTFAVLIAFLTQAPLTPLAFSQDDEQSWLFERKNLGVTRKNEISTALPCPAIVRAKAHQSSNAASVAAKTSLPDETK